MSDLPPVKPLAYHGKNWNAQVLEQEPGGYVFKAASTQKFLASLIGVVGSGLFLLGLFLLLHEVLAALFFMGVASIFLVAKRWFMATGLTGLRVDTAGKRLVFPDNIKAKPAEIRQSEIDAIQFLPYQKHASTLIFAELNLVLKNGERLSVVHYNDLERMRQDGQKLAALLQVPYRQHAIWRLK